MSLVPPRNPYKITHAPEPSAILAAAATNFIIANAGEWADQVESYVPGLIAAQLAALAAHKLQIK